jgi:hypothetical protein
MGAAHKLPDLRLVVGGVGHEPQPATPPNPAVEPRAKTLNTATRPPEHTSVRRIERKRQGRIARETMAALKLSQGQVARGLDEHQTTVARMLAGKAELGRTELVVMARRGCKRLALALLEQLRADIEAA